MAPMDILHNWSLDLYTAHVSYSHMLAHVQVTIPSIIQNKYWISATYAYNKGRLFRSHTPKLQCRGRNLKVLPSCYRCYCRALCNIASYWILISQRFIISCWVLAGEPRDHAQICPNYQVTWACANQSWKYTNQPQNLPQ